MQETPKLLLGLLATQPMHGYELRKKYLRLFDTDLLSGQVYSTLTRLEAADLVTVQETRVAGGPRRRVYRITNTGLDEVRAWLGEVEAVVVSRDDSLPAKIVISVLMGSDGEHLLESQRQAHMRQMRSLTAREPAGMIDSLLTDWELARLASDVEWIENAQQRLRS